MFGFTRKSNLEDLESQVFQMHLVINEQADSIDKLTEKINQLVVVLNDSNEMINRHTQQIQIHHDMIDTLARERIMGMVQDPSGVESLLRAARITRSRADDNTMSLQEQLTATFLAGDVRDNGPAPMCDCIHCERARTSLSEDVVNIGPTHDSEERDENWENWEDWDDDTTESLAERSNRESDQS